MKTEQRRQRWERGLEATILVLILLMFFLAWLGGKIHQPFHYQVF